MLHLKTHMKLTVPPFGVRKRLVSVSLAAMLAALAFAVLRWLPASASPHYVPREVISSPARLSDHVSIRAIGGVDPRVSLRNGHDLLTSYQGPEHLQRALTENQAQPRSLASATLTTDGASSPFIAVTLIRSIRMLPKQSDEKLTEHPLTRPFFHRRTSLKPSSPPT
jgi:hypothetical protein